MKGPNQYHKALSGCSECEFLSCVLWGGVLAKVVSLWIIWYALICSSSERSSLSSIAWITWCFCSGNVTEPLFANAAARQWTNDAMLSRAECCQFVLHFTDYGCPKPAGGHFCENMAGAGLVMVRELVWQMTNVVGTVRMVAGADRGAESAGCAQRSDSCGCWWGYSWLRVLQVQMLLITASWLNQAFCIPGAEGLWWGIYE